MNYREYIAETLDSSFDEHGVQATPEQIKLISRDTELSLENWGMYSGNDVADANWRAMRDKELRQEGCNQILNIIDEIVSELNKDPSNCFDYMSHGQKMAIGRLLNLRGEITTNTGNRQ